MGNFTLANFEKVSVGGANTAWLADLTMSTSYATGGDSFVGASLPFTYIDSLFNPQVINAAGYALDFDQTTQKVLAYSVDAPGGAGGSTGATSGGTPAGTNGTSAVTGTGTGTADAQVFTGARAGMAPIFSGTGLTAVGQVITTTDNQKMALNECAGMWLVSATQATPPNLIISNTAVAAAPAVFTVQGSANTDAGAYNVVASVPSGTNASSAVTVSSLSGTAAAQTFTGSDLGTHTHTIGAGAGGAVALTEVSAAVDLSALTVRVIVFGREV